MWRGCTTACRRSCRARIGRTGSMGRRMRRGCCAGRTSWGCGWSGRRRLGCGEYNDSRACETILLTETFRSRDSGGRNSAPRWIIANQIFTIELAKDFPEICRILVASVSSKLLLAFVPGECEDEKHLFPSSCFGIQDPDEVPFAPDRHFLALDDPIDQVCGRPWITLWCKPDELPKRPFRTVKQHCGIKLRCKQRTQMSDAAFVTQCVECPYLTRNQYPK